jgi:hypothetical protein
MFKTLCNDPNKQFLNSELFFIISGRDFMSFLPRDASFCPLSGLSQRDATVKYAKRGASGGRGVSHMDINKHEQYVWIHYYILTKNFQRLVISREGAKSPPFGSRRCPSFVFAVASQRPTCSRLPLPTYTSSCLQRVCRIVNGLLDSYNRQIIASLR